MASDGHRRQTLLWAFTGTVLGLAIVGWPYLLPFLRPDTGNPLPARFDLATPAANRLVAALQWRDHACATGALDTFAEHVTTDYFVTLRDKLQRLSRRLDGAALKESTAADGGLAELVTRSFCIGTTRGERSAIVAAKELGLPRRGCLGLVMAWDGRAFLLDHVEHGPDVDPRREKDCERFATRLLAR